MKMSFKHAAGAVAFVSLAQPAMAQGTPCVQSDDLADMVTYAVPMLMDGVQISCSDVLPADSFVMGANGEGFADRFAALNDQAWPGARRALMTFMKAEGDNQAMSGMLGEMDDEALRPFVDAIIGPMLAEEITPSSCASIEQILPLIAPLPAENYGPLLATIFSLVSDNDDKLNICPDEQ